MRSSFSMGSAVAGASVTRLSSLTRLPWRASLLTTTAVSAALVFSSSAHAQQTLTATDQASLASAVQTANSQSGDTIVLLNNITLSSALPNIVSPVIINPNGYTLTTAGGGALLTLAPTSPSTSFTFSAGGTFSGPQGAAVALTADGTVLNQATISGGNGNAIYAVTDATVVNNGTLSSSVGSGYDALYVTNNGSLANTGTITGDGAAVQFDGSATVTNSLTGTITGNTGSAIYIRGVGALSNDGTLTSTNSSAVAILQGGNVTNTGYIAGTFGGVQLGSSSYPNAGTLTNTGTIRATVDGGNGATIIGDGGVINNNTGAVIAATTTAGSGSWGVDFEGANETLNNSGGIQGDTGVVFDGGGTLVNTSTGAITGTTTGVNSGAGGVSGAVTITSAGQISGGTYAIQLTGAYDNVIDLQAGSQTTGLISTDSGNDSLTLAGRSTGGVNLGGGNNILTLVGGASAGGTLDGGAGGTNSLVLTGPSNGTVTASQLADFSTVTKAGTGTWFVNGPSTLAASWTIQQGTVQISDVTGVGTAPVVDNGTLSLYGASGNFTNAVSGAGAIYVTGVGAGNTLTFSGDLTTTGANSIASLLVFDASHIAISGTNTSGSIGVAMQGDGGTLDVLSGASITSAGYAVYGGGAGVTVNNAGTLVGHAQGGLYGTGVDLYGGGTLNNTGSVTGDYIGVELGQTGTVNNAVGGAITGLDGNAIYAVAGATIINDGVLASGVGSGYDAVYVTTDGSLANTGTITGDGAAVQFNGSATVTNSATGTISGNNGSAIFIEGAGTLTNAGVLTSTNNEAVAILQGGSVTNTGTITGLYTGVQLGSSSHPLGGTIVNSGTIQATFDGGTGVYTAGAATVTNNAGATIAATLTAGSGSWGVQSDLGALTLTNAGTIQGDAGVVLDAGGTVTNASTGVITGTTTAINSGAGGASGAVNIANAGVITGGDYAIQLTGAYDNTITLQAGSTTTGLISTDSGNDSLTLAGASTGGVNLGAGNNTLTLVSGASAGGTLDGGSGGTNALILSGATSGVVSGSQLVDFATATKTGAGTWSLTGATSGLTASWTVQQGILSVANDAALGSGSLTINGGAEFQATATTGGTRAVTIAGTGADIDVASGATYTLGGVVSGAAGTSLNVNNGGGSGVLAFTANNSATLASDINLDGGTVYAGVTGALGTGTIHVYDPNLVIASGVTVANNVDLHSTFTVEQDSGSGGISGVISESTAGSGLTKIGAGALVLTGANTYTGATTISTGTLALAGSGSIAFSNNVVDNGTLDISGAASAASIKSLSGSGTVALGAETLTLTDASGVFAGNIVGGGGVTFAGGSETLTGVSTYSGATTVSGGTLILDGSLPNSVIDVTSGGSLQGSGVIQNVKVASNGVLSPGGAAAFGQVSPAGNLTLAAGSTYQVNANAAGQADLVAVGGKATVTGATVEVLAAPGAYARNTDYTILTAAGGVTGTFSGVTSNFAFLTPSLSYNGTSVDLTLSNNSIPFQSVAATPNQRATATALYSSDPSTTLYNAVLTQSTAGAQQAFEALSGEMYATAPGVQLDESHYVRDALLGRLRQAADQGASSAGPQSGNIASGNLALVAWAQGIGAWSSGASQQSGNIASSQESTAGAIVGLDGQVKSWRAGLAVAQLNTNLSVSELGSHDTGQNTHVSIYAGGPVLGNLQARVGFDYAWNDMNSGRTVAFPGFLEQVGDRYESRTEDWFGELGYAMHTGRLSVQPYASLAYVQVNTGAINEAGGLAALHIASNDVNAVLSEVGVRAATTFQLRPNLSLEPYATAAWRHVYGDAQSTAALTFESTGVPFNIKGAPIDHDAGAMEAGLTLNTNGGVKLTAAYIGQVSSNWQDNQAKLSVAWSF
jgi:fibronectin-binding autotransporter adhesin